MQIKSDRIFRGESTFPGQEEWFYRTREGIAGPYLNREDAALALCRFVKYCKDNRLMGGREPPPARPPRPIGTVPDRRVGLLKTLAKLAREALSAQAVAALASGRQGPPGQVRMAEAGTAKRDFKKVF